MHVFNPGQHRSCWHVDRVTVQRRQLSLVHYPLGFSQKVLPGFLMQLSIVFFFLSSKSDHCRGVIRGMSYKVTGEGKELRCCLPHWAPSCFFHLLCRATDDGRRRRIAPRVVVPYTVGRKRGKKRGG